MLGIMLAFLTSVEVMAAAAIEEGEAYLIVGTPACPVVLHGKVTQTMTKTLPLNHPVAELSLPRDDGGTDRYTLDSYHQGMVFVSRRAAYWRASQIAREHAGRSAKYADDLQRESER